MKIDNKILNELFEYCKKIVDNNLDIYNYNSDIKHLLYVIIPSFIIKYGIENKNKIINTFESVPIIINNKEEKILQAYYVSIPLMLSDKIITRKQIVLNYYSTKSLMELIDNIIHEYNHAVNSMTNELKWDDEYIYVRAGLTYVKYNKINYLDSGKDDSYILEEIINTKQTEELVNIINSFNNYEINDTIISNALYSINNFINDKYTSEAYLFQSSICLELMNNNTLMSVLSNMRFVGTVDDIPYYFDNITGENGSYNRLIKILNDSVRLEEDFSKVKFFKKRKIKEALRLYKQAKEIIDIFNNNSHFI